MPKEMLEVLLTHQLLAALHLVPRTKRANRVALPAQLEIKHVRQNKILFDNLLHHFPLHP